MFCYMNRPKPRATQTDTHFPYTAPFRYPGRLLRVPPDQDLALKDAARTIVEYPHIDFARAAFRHRMIDEGGVVDMLLAAQHVGAVEAAFDMTAAAMGAQLVARQPAADAQHEAVVDGVVGEASLAGGAVIGVLPLVLPLVMRWEERRGGKECVSA